MKLLWYTLVLNKSKCGDGRAHGLLFQWAIQFWLCGMRWHRDDKEEMLTGFMPFGNQAYELGGNVWENVCIHLKNGSELSPKWHRYVRHAVALYGIPMNLSNFLGMLYPTKGDLVRNFIAFLLKSCQIRWDRKTRRKTRRKQATSKAKERI